MPGNQIVINGAIEYYVGDSKMDELLAWLDNNGIKKETEASEQNNSTDSK